MRPAEVRFYHPDDDVPMRSAAMREFRVARLKPRPPPGEPVHQRGVPDRNLSSLETRCLNDSLDRNSSMFAEPGYSTMWTLSLSVRSSKKRQPRRRFLPLGYLLKLMRSHQKIKQTSFAGQQKKTLIILIHDSKIIVNFRRF